MSEKKQQNSLHHKVAYAFRCHGTFDYYFITNLLLSALKEFLPRDAMLARYIMWPRVRLSVCRSVYLYVSHKAVYIVPKWQYV